MYGREKLTIKGRLFNVCFLQKMLSRLKDWSFTPPENLPGEGLKHTFIRLCFRAKRELSSNLPQKRENRPEDRSAENFEVFWNFSLHLKTANFSSLKWTVNSSSRKILRKML